MTLLHSLRSAEIDGWGHSSASLMWLIKRGICARKIQMLVDDGLLSSKSEKVAIDRMRVHGRDLLLLQTIELVHLGLVGCRNITDQCIVNMLHRFREVKSLEISLTDAGISGLSTECGQLQSISLARCHKVTDAGISALATGCGQLQSINLDGCSTVTDAGVTALATGCGQLLSISLKNCHKVTDTGVTALTAGCGQLQSINLDGCYKVTDAGISALATGCSQLRNVDFGACEMVTNVGVRALVAGCSQLRIIELYYCEEVTDECLSLLCTKNQFLVFNR